MFFLSATSWLYKQITPYSSRTRYLITLFLLIAVWYTWYYAVFSYFSSSTQRMHQEMQQLQQQHKQYKKFQLNLNTHLDTAGSIVVSEKKELSTNPFFTLIESAQNSGLKLIAYATEKEENHDWYSFDYAHLECSGSWENCMKFMQVMQRSTCGVSFEHVRITHHLNECALACSIKLLKIIENKIPSTL